MVNRFEQIPENPSHPFELEVGQEGYPLLGINLRRLTPEELSSAYESDAHTTTSVARRQISIRSNLGLVSATVSLDIARKDELEAAMRLAAPTSFGETIIFEGDKITQSLENNQAVETPLNNIDTPNGNTGIARITRARDTKKRMLTTDVPLILRTRVARKLYSDKKFLKTHDIEIGIGGSRYLLPILVEDSEDQSGRKTIVDDFLITTSEGGSQGKIVLLPYSQEITGFISFGTKPGVRR